jgi:hypothetical protein
LSPAHALHPHDNGSHGTRTYVLNGASAANRSMRDAIF